MALNNFSVLSKWLNNMLSFLCSDRTISMGSCGICWYSLYDLHCFSKSIDWLVLNANFSNISAI
jgi:hypothetical protein